MYSLLPLLNHSYLHFWRSPSFFGMSWFNLINDQLNRVQIVSCESLLQNVATWKMWQCKKRFSNKQCTGINKRLEDLISFSKSVLIKMLCLWCFWGEGRVLQQECRKAHVVALKKPEHKRNTRWLHQIGLKSTDQQVNNHFRKRPACAPLLAA